MPKFSEQEIDVIREQLFEEGEKLFSALGLQKVTINDLTRSVGISHGSFYTFFQNKEHLFMEISMKKEREIFNRLENLIDHNKTLKPHELSKLVLDFLMNNYFTDPIISSINGELWEYIMRRLPQEIIERHNESDAFVVEKLTEVGLKFKHPTSLVIKTVQSIFMLANSIAYDEDSEEIINILIDGLVEKLVEE